MVVAEVSEFSPKDCSERVPRGSVLSGLRPDSGLVTHNAGSDEASWPGSTFVDSCLCSLAPNVWIGLFLTDALAAATLSIWGGAGGRPLWNAEETEVASLSSRDRLSLAPASGESFIGTPITHSCVEDARSCCQESCHQQPVSAEKGSVVRQAHKMATLLEGICFVRN